jgi:tetratricopeptide (TPR) repeat protein
MDDQPRRAIEHYRTALDLSPANWHLIANRLAYLLATHPDSNVRNGQDALRLAQAACQLSNYAAPELLQTLAAAYAELGRFEEAQKVTSQALAIAREQDKPTLVGELERDLTSYRRAEPWRTNPRQRQATEK